MRDKVDEDAKQIGVEIVDVRLKRVDLPQDVTESVYRRMEAERKRVANELRSTGAAEGEKIRADADRQREVILAEAYRDAQKIKGEGDAKASAIYAEAFGQNPSSTRSTAASRPTASFRSKSDLMVLDPSSEFFQYFSELAGARQRRSRAQVARRIGERRDDSLWTALALMLILEGLLPFVAPRLWRETFRKLDRS